MGNTMNDFSNICNILGKLYQDYRGERDFVDFIEFNDLGLPLAYFSNEGLAEPSEDGKKYILETYDLFLTSLDVEDGQYQTLDEIFDIVTKRDK